MNEQEFDEMLKQTLRQDFSAGTAEFREALLARCLAELRDGYRATELSDDELELLAAAGDPNAGHRFDNDGE